MEELRLLSGTQTRLRIYFGEADRVKRKSFSNYVIELARERKLAGCTVFRAISGFGANSVIRTSNILALSADLPIIVEMIDDREHIDSLLAALDPDMPACLVTLEPVEVRYYRSKS